MPQMPQPSIGHLFIDEKQALAIRALYNENKTVYHEYTTGAESQQHARKFLELHALTTESLANLGSHWTSVQMLGTLPFLTQVINDFMIS